MKPKKFAQNLQARIDALERRGHENGYSGHQHLKPGSQKSK